MVKSFLNLLSGHNSKQQTLRLKCLYNLTLADAFIAAPSFEFNVPLVSAGKPLNRVKETNFIQHKHTTRFI